MKKQLLLILTAVLGLLVLFAGCPGKPADVIIGVSFPDFTAERWAVEDRLMKELGAKAGATVVSQIANNNAKLQNDQIDNLVTQGVNVIIIAAEDGAASAAAVERAADAGVPCIAYDRLIRSSRIACYLSFDNVEAGRQQARGVLARVNKGRFALLGGEPTDNNSIQLRKGQMEVLRPFIDSGDIKIVADQWVENWDMGSALKIMEKILAFTRNGVDAVVASNDNTALGALQALKARNLAGQVPISGQDATAAGCNSIVKGELTVTILKDTRNLAPVAIDIALRLARKEPVDGLKDFTLAELTLDQTLPGSVPCRFLEVRPVTRENVYDLVVKSGFRPQADVYKDVPEAAPTVR